MPPVFERRISQTNGRHQERGKKSKIRLDKRGGIWYSKQAVRAVRPGGDENERKIEGIEKSS